jgi:pimeloyl-ACP methyl ester carboxylesterase
MTTNLSPQAIHYEIIDSTTVNQPWLTLAHGFSQNHNVFSAQISQFQQNFRLFLPDLRGHGRSATLTGPYGPEEYTDDIIAALNQAGIKKTHYWGTHTGAAIGLLLALRQPERLQSLVLEGAVLPGFDMPQVTYLLDRARSIAQTQGLQAALDDWFEHADWFAYIREHPESCRAAEHRQMVFEFQGAPWLSHLSPHPVTPVCDHLQAIKLPTLLYNGQYDLTDFKKVAAKLETSLPRVQRAEIPNAGAFPAWENPAEVNQLVQGFLMEKN